MRCFSFNDRTLRRGMKALAWPLRRAARSYYDKVPFRPV